MESMVEAGDIEWLRDERCDWVIDNPERYALRPEIIARSVEMVARIDRLIAALSPTKEVENG